MPLQVCWKDGGSRRRAVGCSATGAVLMDWVDVLRIGDSHALRVSDLWPGGVDDQGRA